MKRRSPTPAGVLVALACAAPAPTALPPPPRPSPTSPYVHISPIGPGYAATNTNATSFGRNTVVTVGDRQFVAYYEPAADGGNVVVARRTIGSDDWTLSPTRFTAFNLADPHDIVAMAIDGDGVMHLSWGMHVNPLQYARSAVPVTATAPDTPIAFTGDLGSGGMTGNEAAVTYPEFVRLPDGDLLYLYRSGAAGDGDLRLDRYDTDTHAWSVVQMPLVDGTVAGDASRSNAYWNTPVTDAEGALHLSWSYRWTDDDARGLSGFQTNHDIHYARSADEGVSWVGADGAPYALPITQSTSDVVVAVARGSSLINQTSMAVDADNRPLVATWWAPEAGSGNHVRQYMLVWSDGADWRVSQLTRFTTDYEDGASRIPEGRLSSYRMGRPVVLVDDDDRVIVLFSDYRMGNTLTMAHSLDREHWTFVELDDTVLGRWEPSYDVERWKRDGVISMLFQPAGLGSASETVSLLEFDARGYFADPSRPPRPAPPTASPVPAPEQARPRPPPWGLRKGDAAKGTVTLDRTGMIP